MNLVKVIYPRELSKLNAKSNLMLIYAVIFKLILKRIETNAYWWLSPLKMVKSNKPISFDNI